MAARLLIISPAWLGDIIMSQSLLKVLKNQEPDCFISVYAPAYAHSILERMSEVDEILTNPFAHGALNLKARYAEGVKLREQHFDRAYILPNSFKSALVPFFAHIKERIGLKGESRYIVINRMRSDKKAFARMVNRYVSLAYINDKSVVGDSTLPAFPYPSLQLQAPTEELLARLHLSLERPLLALGCGANYGPAKLWPVEYFAEVCQHYIKKGWAILGLGTTKDGATVQQIKELVCKSHPEADPFFYDIAGQTSLCEALDLVGVCRAAVCNDSGMMHTVAAAGVPQVCLFGSTATTYTPPLAANARCLESTQPCHPCFARTCRYGTYLCLKELEPERVISTLDQLLASSATAELKVQTEVSA